MRLEEISEEHEAAFLDMIKDYRAGDPATLSSVFKKSDWTSADFRKLVKTAEKDKMDWRPKAGKTSVTHFVLVSADGRICATGRLRFPLDDELEASGGNLVFEVPPSLRKKGFGAYCLALLLFEAVRAGLRRARVNCLKDNVAAARVIAKNRGVLDDVVELGKLRKGASGQLARYWIQFS